MKNTKKIVCFIVAFIYLLLVLLEWVLLKTPSCVTLLAQKIMTLSALLLRHLLLDGWRVVDDDDDNNQSVGEPQAEGVMSTSASFSLS
jgi:hypothetical protein